MYSTLIGSKDELSDTELSGAKTLVEAKLGQLGGRYLNQIMGNTVTYGFIHQNHHPQHNPLVPIVSVSSGNGSLIIVMMYDHTLDVLIYTHPQIQLNRNSGKLMAEGIVLLWLVLHHSLFLKRLKGDEAKSGLHDRFQHDDAMQHFMFLSKMDVSHWPAAEFPNARFCLS